MWIQVGRWDTVDDMLACLSPQQLVEVYVARDVVPLEDGWLQAGVIAAAAHNDAERDAAGRAGKKHVDASRLREPDDYILRVRPKVRPVTKVDEASIAAHQAAIERRYQR